MRWLLTVNGQTKNVEIPLHNGIDRLKAGIQVEGESIELQWHPQLNAFFIEQEINGFRVSKSLSLRCTRSLTVATASESSATLEISNIGGRRLVGSMEPLIPGQKERKLAEAAQGCIVKSPMTGTVLSVSVSEGREVVLGETILVIEAMKMENRISAPLTGMIDGLKVKPGDKVQTGQLLCKLVSR